MDLGWGTQLSTLKRPHDAGSLSARPHFMFLGIVGSRFKLCKTWTTASCISHRILKAGILMVKSQSSKEKIFLLSETSHLFSQGFLPGCTGLQSCSQAQEEPAGKTLPDSQGQEHLLSYREPGAMGPAIPPYHLRMISLGLTQVHFWEVEEEKKRGLAPVLLVGGEGSLSDMHISIHPIGQRHRKCVRIIHSGAMAHFLVPHHKVNTSHVR